MTGITRSAAARIIAGHFHSSAVHVGGTYDTYTVEDNTGRKWKVVSDASIKCQSRGERTASRLYAVEMVTPICKYEDIETIQQLVRELRAAAGLPAAARPEQLTLEQFAALTREL
mgnify:CR=1 FL=1